MLLIGVVQWCISELLDPLLLWNSFHVLAITVQPAVCLSYSVWVSRSPTKWYVLQGREDCSNPVSSH